jgi:hypothetical protein
LKRPGTSWAAAPKKKKKEKKKDLPTVDCNIFAILECYAV